MAAQAPCLSRALLGTMLAFALAGCPGESEPERRERVETPASDALARRAWLEPSDSTDPAVWLASREAGSDVATGTPAVADWDAMLKAADVRFGETDRMIANRAVQLEVMLGEIGVRESVREILDEFMPMSSPGSRRGFSDLCQHYFNLRKQGLPRGEALAALADEAPRAETVTPADPPAAPRGSSPAASPAPVEPRP